MCYSNALSKSDKIIANRYNIPFRDLPGWKPVYYSSGFSHPDWPIVTSDPENSLELYSWGIIPFYAKTLADAAKYRKDMLNVRSETAFEKTSFKKAIAQSRCLIPSSGFYEWREFNKKKYPYFIRVMGEEIFSIAGICNSWTDRETGREYRTFGLLTTSANPLMEKIHNSGANPHRMPVILPREFERDWINPNLTEGDIKALMAQFPHNEMEAHTVSRLVTSRTEPRDVPLVQEPCTYEELEPI
jgi:putative SOS response-associated peptidase YedK